MGSVTSGLAASMLVLTTLGAARAFSPIVVSTPMSTVEFKLVEVNGYLRPIVVTFFNGQPLPMMIHSYATFSVQLRHDLAARFGVRDVKRVSGSYGIERPGSVSSLAPARGVIDRVTVGRSVDSNVPVSIFEVPQRTYGMLGVGWIRRNRVIVDYGSGKVTVSATPAHSVSLAIQLSRRGYQAIPMRFDSKLGIFCVDATISRVTRPMVVATASSTDIDPLFARQAGVSKGSQFSIGSGPTGAQTPRYRLGAPITIKLARWTSPPIRQAEIVDNYAYGGEQRPQHPTDIIGGTLGSPFLMEAEAIVDFGSSTLYLK